MGIHAVWTLMEALSQPRHFLGQVVHLSVRRWRGPQSPDDSIMGPWEVFGVGVGIQKLRVDGRRDGGNGRSWSCGRGGDGGGRSTPWPSVNPIQILKANCQVLVSSRCFASAKVVS